MAINAAAQKLTSLVSWGILCLTSSFSINHLTEPKTGHKE